MVACTIGLFGYLWFVCFCCFLNADEGKKASTDQYSDPSVTSAWILPPTPLHLQRRLLLSIGFLAKDSRLAARRCMCTSMNGYSLTCCTGPRTRHRLSQWWMAWPGPPHRRLLACSCARWDSFLFKDRPPAKDFPATLLLSAKRHKRRSGNQKQVFSREDVAGRWKDVAQ